MTPSHDPLQELPSGRERPSQASKAEPSADAPQDHAEVKACLRRLPQVQRLLGVKSAQRLLGRFPRREVAEGEGAAKLRAGLPAVPGRLSGGWLLLDLFAIADEELGDLAGAVDEAWRR